VEERDQLVLSKPIIDELLGILGRKFSRDAEELAHAAVFLSDLALFVKPRRRLRVVKDDPDIASSNARSPAGRTPSSPGIGCCWLWAHTEVYAS
jgi:hypothetical protein